MTLRNLQDERIGLQKRLDSELIIEGWIKRRQARIRLLFGGYAAMRLYPPYLLLPHLSLNRTPG